MSRMVDPAGLEPATFALQMQRSKPAELRALRSLFRVNLQSELKASPVYSVIKFYLRKNWHYEGGLVYEFKEFFLYAIIPVKI